MFLAAKVIDSFIRSLLPSFGATRKPALRTPCCRNKYHYLCTT